MDGHNPDLFTAAVALALGILFLGEPLTAGIAIGFPLVLVGSWFASRKH